MTVQTWEEAAEEVAQDVQNMVPYAIGTWDGFRHDFGRFIDGKITGQPDAVTFVCLAADVVALRSDGESPHRYLSGVTTLIASKQHDYGHENIAKFGTEGLKVRLWDKVARYENLKRRHVDRTLEVNPSAFVPLNESIEDTLDDIVGYCIIGAMVERGTFYLSLAADAASAAPLRSDLTAESDAGSLSTRAPEWMDGEFVAAPHPNLQRVSQETLENPAFVRGGTIQTEGEGFREALSDRLREGWWRRAAELIDTRIVGCIRQEVLQHVKDFHV